MVVTRMAYRRKRTGALWIGAAVCAAAFAGVWSYVYSAAPDGGLTQADKAAADWTAALLAGPDAFWETVTTFGDTMPIIAAALVLMLAAAFIAGWRQAIWIPIAAAAAYGLNSAVKAAAGRPRPEAAWGIEAAGFSFPSANAMMIFTILLMFAVMISRSRRMPGWAAALVWIAAIAVSIAMGLSRLYFAVHYGTDIAAGFALGGAVVFAAAALSVRLS